MAHQLTTNKRKINSIQSQLGRLARHNCTNYQTGGGCPLQTCGSCIVGIKTDSLPGNVCPYFMRHVLPADPELESEYLDYMPASYPLKKTGRRRNMKECARCGGRFEAKSNRAKYCEPCRGVVKRAQTVESNRKTRANDGR